MTIIHNLSAVQSDGSGQVFREEILPGCIYRIKTDVEVTDWQGRSTLDATYHKFLSRTANVEWRKTHPFMAQAPQTVRLNLDNGKSAFSLSLVWQNEVYHMNDEAASKYLTRGGSGWVNKDTWPLVAAVLFRNNKVMIDSVDGDRAYIKHFELRYRPPGEYMAYNRHAFTVITEDGRTIYPDPPGMIVWMPLVLPCAAWLPVTELTARPLV